MNGQPVKELSLSFRKVKEKDSPHPVSFSLISDQKNDAIAMRKFIEEELS